MSIRFHALLMCAFAAVGLAAHAESLGPISEETPPAVCDPGSFLKSIACTGNDCDNIKISCQKPFAATLGAAVWTKRFSEEHGGRGLCPSGYFIGGLACSGSNCDDISLYCVQVTNKQAGSCVETSTFATDGKPELSVFTNPNFDKAGQIFLANGMRCKGDHCDDMWMNVCEMH